ncbi:allantoinase AllB [Solicola gregarius]|uniref:allantoinase n=1 Tax=Solicola gregarius TaxID=2908642 RepID=A0AA46TGN1_9ACTN|nr:allantoinase AllB [Solicola gregarius]UYM04193.1 allantoinase AllB [Solicola gregarius]
MSDLDTVIRAPRVVVGGREVAASVGIRDGSIVALAESDADLRTPEVVELGPDEVLLPGVVDTHVHVNDPGRTEWEGFVSATRAAAVGGVTTIVDMPLNSIPPTVDVDALTVKRDVAGPRAYVDVGFWGGAIPGNVRDLRALHDAGVFGFKCFLVDSGVDEFPALDDAALALAMNEIAAFDGLFIVHAEDAHTIDGATGPEGRDYRRFLESRPGEAETVAIARVIDLARTTGCRVHIVHVSSADALPEIATARRAGVHITAETCPHYLTFGAEEVPAGGTQFKCCPPIRERDNRERLWEGLRDGSLDTVVTDHSPSTVELKHLDTGDFGTAWGGISSLQLGLPAVWSGARERGFDLAEVVSWMCAGPARQVGLRRKGRIAVGYDADLCVFAPDEDFVVDAVRLQHKNPVTPYAGRTLTGVVRETWLRGGRVDIAADPRGRLLKRGDA